VGTPARIGDDQRVHRDALRTERPEFTKLVTEWKPITFVWFGLATVVLLPATIAQLGRHGEPMPKRRTLNLAIAFSMLALAGITVIVTFAHL
jgi:hypothetical protein